MRLANGRLAALSTECNTRTCVVVPLKVNLAVHWLIQAEQFNAKFVCRMAERAEFEDGHLFRYRRRDLERDSSSPIRKQSSDKTLEVKESKH